MTFVISEEKYFEEEEKILKSRWARPADELNGHSYGNVEI